MTFEVHQYPYHRVVYRISENADVVYIGEGLATRLGTTLTDVRIDPATGEPRKYSVLMHDEHGNPTGTAELHYVNVDNALAKALPVPSEMGPGRQYQTQISTNVENVLLALFAWQNGKLPRDNGIQGDGANKGGWIADCESTLQTYYKLYEDMALPCSKQWPSTPDALPERPSFLNGNPMKKFLAAWWSESKPDVLNIGFCSVDGTTPHMTTNMRPKVKHELYLN